MSHVTNPTATSGGGNRLDSKSGWLAGKIFGTFWFNLITAFVVLGLLQAFVVKVYAVQSRSMAPTLEVSDRIVVNRLAYLGSEPDKGDVVVFKSEWDHRDPTRNPLRRAAEIFGDLSGIGIQSDLTVVKRIMASPGQSVSCCDQSGSVLVDSVKIDDLDVESNFPFVDGELECDSVQRSLRCFPEVIVPQASYLVLGDNRSNSDDSIYHCRGLLTGPDVSCYARFVERNTVVGKAIAVVWPIANWKSLG